MQRRVEIEPGQQAQVDWGQVRALLLGARRELLARTKKIKPSERA